MHNPLKEIRALKALGYTFVRYLSRSDPAYQNIKLAYGGYVPDNLAIKRKFFPSSEIIDLAKNFKVLKNNN